jgi:UDPglucose 6-dehydrogenase
VANYWEQVVEINKWQQKRISSLIIRNLFGTLSNKRLGVFGFSFKANTNDTRESPSINISNNLLREGAKLSFYDPKVIEKQIFLEFEKSEYKDNISVNDTPLKSAEGADAIIVLTEWEEFSSLDWQKMFNVMRKPAWVFDARAFLDTETLKNIGFKVWSLGSV